MTIFRYSIPLILMFSAISCSGINTIHSGKKNLALMPGNKIHISAQHCNREQCISDNSEIHTKTQDILVSHLESQGVIFTTKEKADFQIHLISAFEEKIDKNLPRNIYLIVQDKYGQEVLQMGLADHFSTPLKSEFVSYNEIETKLNQLISNSFVAPTYVAKTDTENQ